MMRKTPASAMQKTYDECYLICSTAIYFEGLNNEAEALRAWRNALDQIYYHNAYKMPSGFMPRSETEKALQDSLRSMELQCKERVELLEALKKSRQEAEEEGRASGSEGPAKSRESLLSINKPSSSSGNVTWMGGNTVPPASFSDIPRPPPTPDRRPVAPSPRISNDRPNPLTQISGNDSPRTMSLQNSASPHLVPPTEIKDTRTRTPSPEKKGGMLKTLRANPKEKPTNSGKMASTLRNRPQNTAASRAATQVWAGPRNSIGSAPQHAGEGPAPQPTTMWDPQTKRLVHRPALASGDERRSSSQSVIRPPSPSDYVRTKNSNSSFEESRNYASDSRKAPYARQASDMRPTRQSESSSMPPPPPPHAHKPLSPPALDAVRPPPASLADLGPSSLSYMKEYPNHPPLRPKTIPTRSDEAAAELAASLTVKPRPPPPIPRKQVNRAAGVVSATAERRKLDDSRAQMNARVRADSRPLQRGGPATSAPTTTTRPREEASAARAVTPPSTDESPDSDHPDTPTDQEEWDIKVKKFMKELPKGVDEAAAKQIFNEIVIQGDEVHWDDVAGLENAKSALKETVVYPFLRPDLFMGLREPARGMLLFGPPGTGKTMLARAVATESKSVFFAISASSLTSKFLGESEKLVRALFGIAKQLAPSIIFVDEIDSLLGSRGGSSEHEATRRIKTEFLIQWSDLQKAAAGREDKDKGDASRVLVLAATNLPWAIDEAARRRFVRRQYIPLPEDYVREKQLLNLMSAQKHSLGDRELKQLVRLTDGFSGSDITALAKDAAMGPLRSLGEKLLHMSPDDIRPIGMQDFQASLEHIRPSVSKQGLKEFEDWARDFGSKG